jgi:hypothetical protein
MGTRGLVRTRGILEEVAGLRECHMQVRIIGLALSGAFVTLTGCIIWDSMTCGEWYCQWLLFLPTAPWFLVLLPFVPMPPPIVNYSVAMISILLNTLMFYLLGAYIEKRLRKLKDDE